MQYPRIEAPIALIGMGLSNLSVQKYLLTSGFNEADIFVYQDEDGEDAQERLQEAKTFFVSPGYPLSKPWLHKLKHFKQGVTSELALAYALIAERKSGETIVGVSGSLGKSTTVSLIHAGLVAANQKAELSGNIGKPLLDYVMATSDEKAKYSKYIVLELSSYQLENCGDLNVDISCLTNFSPNHLSRYPSLEAYYAQKLELIGRTKNMVFVNEQSTELVKTLKSVDPQKLRFYNPDDSLVFDEKDWKAKRLVGAHNKQNLEAAALVLKELGCLSEDAKAALLSYSGLPHRLQKISLPLGAPTVINDSKCTSIDGIKVALACVAEEENMNFERLTLLIGGQDKDLPWQDLASLPKGIRFLFFGEVGPKAKDLSQIEGPCFQTLDQLIGSLKIEDYSPQDWILLSPGGTSFDEFKNFEERGKVFSERMQQKWN